MDVILSDCGEGFGWCVRLESEVADDVEDPSSLLSGVLGGLHGCSEGPDGSLGVGSVEGVYGRVDLVLGEVARCVRSDDVGGFGQSGGYSGFEVGFVG